MSEASVIPVEVFKPAVLLLIGKDEGELRNMFMRVTRESNFSPFGVTRKYFFGEFMKCCFGKTDSAGFTYVMEGVNAIVVYLPEPDNNALVHELVHAADLIMDNAGIRDASPSEVRAYLVQYLFGKIVKG